MRKLLNYGIIAILLISCNSADRKSIQLVKNGKSAYRIIVSENAKPAETRAAEILQHYIEKISGAKLSILSDKEAPSDNEIIIGNNSRFEFDKIGINTDSLDLDGFHIKTIGHKLIIAGGKENGCVYAVYTLLEKYMGCRKYTADSEEIPHSKDISLPETDLHIVPLIKHRQTHFLQTTDPVFADWHKLDTFNIERYAKPGWVHTFHKFVPEKLFSTHPEYFGMVNGRRNPSQLCLSNPTVLEIVKDSLKIWMKRYPETKVWDVSQNDNVSYCQCPKCKALDDKEGSPAGSVISFVNKIADAFPDKIISTLAYQYTRKAPKTVKPKDNVLVVLCSIECDRSKPLAEDTTQGSFTYDLTEWGKITKNIHIWDYVVDFRNLLSPFPNLRVLQPNIQLFVKNNVSSLFEQGSWSKGEMYQLRSYLIAKLMWEPYLNADSVIRDFCMGYYGKAGPFVLKYINKLHDQMEKSGDRLDIYGYPYYAMNSYLKPELLKHYSNLFDSAELAVKNNPKYLERVIEARLPIEYAIIEIARQKGLGEGGLFETEASGKLMVIPAMKKRIDNFIDNCLKFDIQKLEEHGWPTTKLYKDQLDRLIEKTLAPNLVLNKPVQSIIKPGHSYMNGNPAVLTDRLFGSNEVKTNWLGYEGVDMDVIIDLGNETGIESISTTFFQNVLYWIFIPENVEYFISNDGKNFKKIGLVNRPIPLETSGEQFIDYKVAFDKTNARYIRVKADGINTCPAWHRGSGYKSWIFVDEVVVL